MSNAVDHPSHYADKRIEVIDYLSDTLTLDEYVGFCIGNVLKYVSRWRKKGGVEDLKKAQVYLQWAIEAAPAVFPQPDNGYVINDVNISCTAFAKEN
jgi:hypothetical protein